MKRRAIFKIYVLYSYNWNSITKQCWSFGPTRGWGREGVWLNPDFQDRKNAWNCKSTLFLCLTLFGPAYFGISGTVGGGHIVPPLSILGLGGVRVPILFGNDLPMNDWPYSKGFMKFGCLEPSKMMFDFCSSRPVLLMKIEWFAPTIAF